MRKRLPGSPVAVKLCSAGETSVCVLDVVQAMAKSACCVSIRRSAVGIRAANRGALDVGSRRRNTPRSVARQSVPEGERRGQEASAAAGAAEARAPAAPHQQDSCRTSDTRSGRAARQVDCWNYTSHERCEPPRQPIQAEAIPPPLWDGSRPEIRAGLFQKQWWSTAHREGLVATVGSGIPGSTQEVQPTRTAPLSETTLSHNLGLQ